MSFAWKLKTIRTNQGINQVDLAKKIGVSQKTISSWETGRTEPTMKDISSLCHELDCSVEELTDTRVRKIGDISFDDIIVKLGDLSAHELKQIIDQCNKQMRDRDEIERMQKEKALYQQRIAELERQLMEKMNGKN